MPTRLTCGFSYSCQLSVDGLASGRQQAGRKGHLELVDRIDHLLEADGGVDGIVVVLERVALGFGQHGLVGAGKSVGGTEVEHGGAQHALVGAADLGGKEAGEDQLSLHLLVAQLDVEVFAVRARRVRGIGRKAEDRADEHRTAPQYASCAIVPPKECAASLWAARTLCQMAMLRAKSARRALCAPTRTAEK